LVPRRSNSHAAAHRDTPKPIRTRQDHVLIQAHTGTLVHRMRAAPLEQQVRLGAHDKEGRAERKDKKPLKIDTAPVHHVEGPSLGHDLVEDMRLIHGELDAEFR
jgi:hypothetical protein